MNRHKVLLLENKAWAREKLEDDPEFFIRSAQGQHPEFLWIGCSDSRVPAEEITNCEPGQMFLHRNIANQVLKDDENVMSVLQYAVEVLKVKHIIVCGHYECGGVKASMGEVPLNYVSKWLGELKVLYNENHTRINTLSTESERTRLLVELNVEQQVRNLAATPLVKEALAAGQNLFIHGWVYDIHTGLLNHICEISPGQHTVSAG